MQPSSPARPTPSSPSLSTSSCSRSSPFPPSSSPLPPPHPPCPSSCSKLAGLEQLEELELSGNRLRAVPTTILSCRRLHTLAAHSNCITVFPEVLQLPEIKVPQGSYTHRDVNPRHPATPKQRTLCLFLFPSVSYRSSDMSCNKLTDVFCPSVPLPRQCVDVSCNEITEVSLPESLPAKLQELDLTGNPRLTLDHKSLELLK